MESGQSNSRIDNSLLRNLFTQDVIILSVVTTLTVASSILGYKSFINRQSRLQNSQSEYIQHIEVTKLIKLKEIFGNVNVNEVKELKFNELSQTLQEQIKSQSGSIGQVNDTVLFLGHPESTNSENILKHLMQTKVKNELSDMGIKPKYSFVIPFSDTISVLFTVVPRTPTIKQNH